VALANAIGPRTVAQNGLRDSRRKPGGLQPRDRLPVERDEGLSAQPVAVMGDHAIREIATGFEHGESRFGGGPIGFDLADGQQGPDRCRDIRARQAINLEQDPGELAQTRQRDGDVGGEVLDAA